MNTLLKTSVTLNVLGLVLVSVVVAADVGKNEDARAGSLNTGAIEKGIGKRGELKDGVYKASWPRTDLSVTVEGVKIKPGLALGSWAAFKAAGNTEVVDGDLVLTQDEIGPVFQKLRAEGIEVTALHNHLVGESPRVMFLHIFGQGDAAKLAVSLKSALSLTTKTPISETSSEGRNEGSAKTSVEEAGFNIEQIQQQLGHKGAMKGGVLQVSVPRPEDIKMKGVVLPSSMGMATAFNFQQAGEGKVAATGDFVMIGDEVDGVTKALVQHGILITALHNHLVHSTPDLYFMHFWANDTPDKVAKSLRAELDAMQPK